ncbi:thioesterase-like superfamily-domain-containing protein, partial [Lipomyces tetrasporus]
MTGAMVQVRVSPLEPDRKSSTKRETVPHGGYIVSCFMRAVTAHFRDTLKRNQPHTITLHVEFTRRTQIGPASIVIRDVKLGGRLSTVRVALIQQGKEVVLAYI